MRHAGNRIPICYVAPWVDYGGTDKATIDWFRWLDRDRFAPLLVTTQPSPNRRLSEVYPYAEEVWNLPEFLGGQHFPGCIFDLIHTRGVQVLHIMNSRLGFDLLPDLAALPSPPATVVQLHVEEPDKSGYVRYVTTRYGNLVDGFSVVSHDLARTVESYDVTGSKIHAIPLGVDGKAEFNPSRIRPLGGLSGERFNILYPGRLADQKDPLLMVRVIQEVVGTHPHAHVHVVGDGPLEAAIQTRIAELELTGNFSFHPPTPELPRWYAASDLLLMTSLFEGVPCVIYEAMAMALPIVAPALPGNVELMADTAGVLIEPRDDVTAYARAVIRMMDGRDQAAALGEAGRRRVLEHFDVRAMADRHGQLYDELIACRRSAAPSARRSATSSPLLPDPDRAGERTSVADVTTPGDRLGPVERATEHALRFPNRPTRGQPLVTVVVPCFNHGRFLPECIESIVGQHYEAIEIIIVDDASSDADTVRSLSEIESEGAARVIRQPHNAGPSSARNRGINESRGRYILPVDADNLLLPGALTSLVEQLQGANETVGYIYPNCQYFGTRDDYFEAPRFNPALLLDGNYCDTCSLIDRDVFDAGVGYADDITLGHEDWDFVLTLVARGVRGEPARCKTLLYRKHGFTRSDAVEYSNSAFHETVKTRHPELYGTESNVGRFGAWNGPAVQIKAKHAPGLSVVVTTPVDFAAEPGARLITAFAEQTCADTELIVECTVSPRIGDLSIRRIPPGLCEDRIAFVNEALGLARATRILLLDAANLSALVAERSFVERLHRTFWANPALQAVAFARGNDARAVPFGLLREGEIAGPARAIAWQIDEGRKLASPLLVSERSMPDGVAQAMATNGTPVQWRHLAATDHAASTSEVQGWIKLPELKIRRTPHDRHEQAMLSRLAPAVPALNWDAIRRWLGAASWLPPETELLTRHRAINGPGRILRWGRVPPPGFALERDIGAIQRFAPPGTARLVRGARGLHVVPRGSPRSAEVEELGHLELAPLPLFRAVERAVLDDGTETLLTGDDDPLRTAASELEFLGYVEAFPNLPSHPPDARRENYGVVGLLRCLDIRARRHVYRIGSPLPGETLVGELGALHLVAEPGSVPMLCNEHGQLIIAEFRRELAPAGTRTLMHWSTAPLAWRGFGSLTPRLRASMRRSWEALRIARGGSPGVQSQNGDAPPSTAEATRIGYLYRDAAPGRSEMFAARHPATGDLLLTRHPLEAGDMGYGHPTSLGHIIDRAPATGSLDLRRVPVPWASRFGLTARRT